MQAAWVEGEGSRRKWSPAPETGMGIVLCVSVEQTSDPTRLQPLIRSRCNFARAEPPTRAGKSNAHFWSA